MSKSVSISANQLRAGDVVAYGGRRHHVTDVVRRIGGSWPIAVDGTGWGMALGDRPVTVWRG